MRSDILQVKMSKDNIHGHAVPNFNRWTFVYRYIPGGENSQLEVERVELQRFVNGALIPDNAENARKICEIMERYDTAYDVAVNLEYINCQMFMDAYAEYILQKDNPEREST